jgi:sulfopyruvate decarboxylase subunit alpha
MTATAADAVTLSGGLIVEALHRARVTHVLAVPDIVTSRGLLTPISKDPRFKLVRVCKEDECIGIAAALAVCGHRAVTLFQNTGFLDSVNAIAHVGVQYKLPVVMVIGLLARELERAPGDSHRLAVRVVEPMLASMGIGSRLLDRDTDVEDMAARIDAAFDQSRPYAFLIGRRPVP